MQDLTPEERQRIYLEEKARFEIRQELRGTKPSAGKVVGVVVLCGLGLLVFLFIMGTMLEDSRRAAFQKLTPEEQHQKAVDACAEFLNSSDIRFKTYSELSVDERRMKASCAAR